MIGVDNSSSSHTDNQTNKLLVLDEGSTDGIEDSTSVTERKFSINSSKAKTKILL